MKHSIAVAVAEACDEAVIARLDRALDLIEAFLRRADRRNDFCETEERAERRDARALLAECGR